MTFDDDVLDFVSGVGEPIPATRITASGGSSRSTDRSGSTLLGHEPTDAAHQKGMNMNAELNRSVENGESDAFLVTRGMFRRNLLSPAAFRRSLQEGRAADGFRSGAHPELMERSMAEHRARCAWADVEQAALDGYERVGTPDAGPSVEQMCDLVQQAHAADAAVRVAVARCEAAGLPGFTYL